MTQFHNQNRGWLKHLMTGIFVVFSLLVALILLNTAHKEQVEAAGATFWLTINGTDATGFPSTVSLQMDADAEGGSLLGSEAGISYDKNAVTIHSSTITNCPFNSCIDLSEEGSLRLIGASGKPDEGGVAVSGIHSLASISLTVTAPTTITFNKCEIIDGLETIRTCIGLPLVIEAPEGYEPVCGNGVLEEGESCDDGNDIDDDNCTNACLLHLIIEDPAPAFCGNGIVEPPESCDDGNDIDDDDCTNECLLFLVIDDPFPLGFCGNGIVEPGETCDDGNNIDDDQCSNACALKIHFDRPPFEFKELSHIQLDTHGGSRTVGVGQSLPLNTFAYYTDGSSQNITSPPPTLYRTNHFQRAFIDFDRIVGNVETGPVQVSASYTEGLITKEDSLVINVTDKIPDEWLPPPPLDPLPEPDPDDSDTDPDPDEEVEREPDLDPDVRPSPPEEPEPLPGRLGDCSDDPRFTEANLESRYIDSDGDGFSDRTECYLGTHPLLRDSDLDGCSDYAEKTHLGTDPNRSGDCIIEKPTQAEEPAVLHDVIFITDPQDGWILIDQTPDLAGITGLRTTEASITAYYAEQSILNQMELLLNDMENEDDAEKWNTQNEEYLETLKSLRLFVDENNGFFNYQDLEQGTVFLEDNLPYLDQASQESEDEAGETTSEDFEYDPLLDQLEALEKPTFFLGSSTEFSETRFGDMEAKRFEYEAKAELEDRKLYDIIATGNLEPGDTIHSNSVRFGVAVGEGVQKPIPISLSNVPVISNESFGKLIQATYAQSAELNISEPQPVLTGESEFGTQVYAIWNSIVLASSIITDSQEGTFEIQSPEPLEISIPHRVTVYATQYQNGRTIRSESTDVYFRIHPPKANYLLYFVLGGILILMLIIFMIWRRSKTKKQLASENGTDFEELHRSAPSEFEMNIVNTRSRINQNLHL